MSIAERLAAVQRRVDQACAAAGRPRDQVRLLAASKTRSAHEIIAGVVAGIDLLGENRAQELRDKFEAVHTGLPSGAATPEWHFIGPLQRNKVKYVVGRATMVHAVDSMKLAQELSKRVQQLPRGAPPPAGPPLQILVEVNVAGELSKAGVPPDQALELCHQAAELPGLELRGLMTIPPPTADPDQARAWFAQVRRLSEQGREQGLDLVELSMGMSADLGAAIAEGSTIVRVGTAIFGPRG